MNTSLTKALLTLTAVAAFAVPAAAQARNGADDPAPATAPAAQGSDDSVTPGSDDALPAGSSGGQGADDPVGHVRHSGDDGPAHRANRSARNRARRAAKRAAERAARRARHGGADDGPGHR
jgi:hypothetical protein